MKGQVDSKALLKQENEFEVGDEKEYEVEAIINSTVYGQQVNNS